MKASDLCRPSFTWAIFLTGALVLGACAAPPSPKAAPQKKSEKPVREAVPVSAPVGLSLPSGALPPRTWPATVDAKVVASESFDGVQTLLLEISGQELPPLGNRAVVASDGAPIAHSFVEDASEIGEEAGVSREAALVLWVRRPLGNEITGPEAVKLTLFTPPEYQEEDNNHAPGWVVKVQAEGPGSSASDSALFGRYLTALHRVSLYPSPFKWLLARPAHAEYAAPSRDVQTQEWAELMALTSGYQSIESAVASRKYLALRLSPEKAVIPLATLRPPALDVHPYREMSAKLPRLNAARPGAKPEDHPFARVVPADFYALRAKSFSAFQTLLDQVSEIVTPTVDLLENQRTRTDLAERYRLELGLPESELSRIFGPSLIDEVVVTGSDPFLRDGSDVTLLLATKDPKRLLGALAVIRAELGSSEPLEARQENAGGITIDIAENSAKTVRQRVSSFEHQGRAWVAVSNSTAALTRVIATHQGRVPALFLEEDFRFMLARDPQEKEDVLAYVGDAFVARNVSANTRVLDARRKFARSEFLSVGYGALLYRMLYGRAPATFDELLEAPWMSPTLSKHSTGEALTFSSGTGPQSFWGTPARLTSLIDLPPVKRVTATEKAAYEEFRETYEGLWSEKLDPIAVRISVSEEELSAAFRILPLMNAPEYAEVARLSGGARSPRHATLPGLSGILAVGPESGVREMLGREGSTVLPGVKFDWLGDFIEFGLADDATLVDEAVRSSTFALPPGSPPRHVEGEWAALLGAPWYAVVDLKSAAGAAVLLGMARTMMMESAGGAVSWGETGKWKGVSIIRVSVGADSIFYALTPHRLFLSTQGEVLRRLLETKEAAEAEAPSGTASSTGTAAPSGGQLALELTSGGKTSALALASYWLYEQYGSQDMRSPDMALLLLRGSDGAGKDKATYRSEALKYLGVIPVTFEGRAYQLKRDGLTDPLRGTAHSPIWPRLPAEGSPLTAFFTAASRLRAEMSVEAEPTLEGENSLNTRVRLELRK